MQKQTHTRTQTQDLYSNLNSNGSPAFSSNEKNKKTNATSLVQNLETRPFDLNQFIQENSQAYLNSMAFYPQTMTEKIQVQSSTFDPSMVEPSQQDEDEILKYMIKDLDSGQVYDQRNLQGESASLLDEQKYTTINVNQNDIWNDFMQQSSREQENLLEICQVGNLQKLQEMVLNSNNAFFDINTRFLDKYTPLHFASQEGHLSIVQFLLQHNSDFCAKTNFERTPLHLSCIRGHYEVTQVLCDSGSDVNQQDKDFNTPLHYASTYGFTKILAYLLTQKPELQLRNFQEMTSEDCALNVDILQLFNKVKTDEQKDKYSRMALEGSLLRNSRVDHIERLLFLTKKQNASIMNESDIKDKSDLTKSKDEGKQELHRFKKGMDEKELHLQQQLSQINQIIIEDIKNDKVGPEDFVIKDTLGKGSFGSVYLVQLKGTENYYAMKTLQKEKLYSKNIVQYALTERNVLSFMNHPFIVKLNYAFQTQRKLFLVMQYCPGGDLESLLLQHGTLPEKLVKIYAAEIILAIQALHKACIIFRDLKPGNVVIDEEGHVNITDFGLSKEGISENIKTQSFCGSLAYLAPEMLEQQGHGYTLDWYLLGVLIYQLLEGDPPFFDVKKESLLDNIRKNQYEATKNCSKDADNIILKLLNRDPDQRLGCNGADEIKAHPWFANINWTDVYNRQVKPPIKVQKRNLNIPTELEKLKLTVTPSERETDKNSNNYMPGWSFAVNPQNKNSLDEASANQTKN